MNNDLGRLSQTAMPTGKKRRSGLPCTISTKCRFAGIKALARYDYSQCREAMDRHALPVVLECSTPSRRPIRDRLPQRTAARAILPKTSCRRKTRASRRLAVQTYEDSCLERWNPLPVICRVSALMQAFMLVRAHEPDPFRFASSFCSLSTQTPNKVSGPQRILPRSFCLCPAHRHSPYALANEVQQPGSNEASPLCSIWAYALR